MTIEYSDNLERELAGLTRARDEAPTLWKAALDSTRRGGVLSGLVKNGGGGGGSGAGGVSILRRRLPMGVYAAAAVLVLCVLVVTAMMPAMSASGPAPTVDAQVGASQWKELAEADVLARAYRDADGEGRSAGSLGLAYAGVPVERVPGSPGAPSPAPQDASGAAPAPADRMVIRKAQLELRTPDVRATFMKCTMVLSEAQGEYMEESGMSGADASLSATLKLRVAATRLGAVLQQLRELGTVVSEAAGGEDVTEQMVDLEARIRNEQKVEAELLGLLGSRKDAPLEDILKVRESIGRVRESIERMTASREQLSRLVSLATVLVIIRADAAPTPEVKPAGPGEYFTKGMGQAWDRGVKGLADSAATIVRVAVGGLFFWIALAFGVLALRILWVRMQRALAAEPAPRG